MFLSWLFGKREKISKIRSNKKGIKRLHLESLECRLVPTLGFLSSEFPGQEGGGTLNQSQPSVLQGRCLSSNIDFDTHDDHNHNEYNEGHEFTDSFGNAISACPLPKNTLIKFTSVNDLAFDTSNTFLLNSQKNASKTIYLDFTGHNTQGTAWNSWRKIDKISTPEYNSDRKPGLSALELSEIHEIWARVAEDFCPFDVNVTTQEPSVEDLIKNGENDTRWGVRLAIGGSADWLGSNGIGGIAYIGSFNWNTDTPAYVFSDRFSSAKDVAEAVSHEIGHTLGLRHDGRVYPSEEYYAGQGSGSTSWAPIMGSGYYSEVVQWSRGEYANASNKEDDLSIITSNNGFGYRPDEAGNNTQSAKLIGQIGSATRSFEGIIQTGDDVDVYSFTSTGDFKVSILGAKVGANLDVYAEIRGASGRVIASSNPDDSLNSSLDVSGGAGTYYLLIRGTGFGNPATNGYSNYGSIGQYRFSIKGAGDNPVIPNAPTNLISGMVTPESVKLSWKDNSTNESSFKIYQSLNGSNWTLAGTVGSNQKEFLATGLKESTSYKFKVLACNASGDSLASNIINVTTETKKLLGPNNLVASSIQNNSFKLSWGSPAGNVDRFEVWLKVDGAWKRSENVQGHRRAATIEFEASSGPRLKPGKIYQVKMRAIGQDGKISDWSNEISVRMAR